MHLVFSSKLLTAPFASDYLEQILNQLSKAVLLAVNGGRALPELVPHALRDLAKLEARPLRLAEIVYEWCSAIYENREKFEDWEGLLLVCLELGFRHLDPSDPYIGIRLTHTEHHRALVDLVFKSQKSEAIADLLRAWTTTQSSHFTYHTKCLACVQGTSLTFTTGSHSPQDYGGSLPVPSALSVTTDSRMQGWRS